MEIRSSGRVRMPIIHNENMGKRQKYYHKNERLTVVNETHFPYLDMEIYWNDRYELKLQVHMKSNQKLKYLNKNITHLPSVFKAIPKGVFNRLGKITSKSKKREKIIINKIYPLHINTLKIAGLAPKNFPTFLELEISGHKN